MASPVNSLGFYRPLNTPIHKLDSRVKLILLVVFMVIIFIPYGNPANSPYPYATDLVVAGGILLLVTGLAALARVRITRVFKTIGRMWFLVVFVVVLNLFFYRPDESFANTRILFYAGNWPVYETGLWFSGYVCTRVILTVISTLVITSATGPMEISDAFEFFLSPLKLIKIPVSAFSMMMSLALRFVPVLSSEAQRIQKAQAARGLDSKNGTFKDKFRSLFSLLIPLLLISFMDAIASAEAMESRGYDPRAKRTKYATRRFRIYDALWLCLAFILLAGMLFLSIYRIDGLRLEIFPRGAL